MTVRPYDLARPLWKKTFRSSSSQKRLKTQRRKAELTSLLQIARNLKLQRIKNHRLTNKSTEVQNSWKTFFRIINLNKRQNKSKIFKKQILCCFKG